MNRHPWLNLLIRWAVLALGVAMSAMLVPGITYDTTLTLVVVAVLLSVFNAILKPVLVIFTLPFVVLTLGLGIWVINAFLFLAVSKLVPGFYVHDFWSALWGALIVSVTNMLLSRRLTVRSGPRPPPPPPPRARSDDVIDI